MKITKRQLKQIIREELKNAIEESREEIYESEEAIIHRDKDEVMPADHKYVKNGACKAGERVVDCMKNRPWDP